jgi:hypothetical protein
MPLRILTKLPIAFKLKKSLSPPLLPVARVARVGCVARVLLVLVSSLSGLVWIGASFVLFVLGLPLVSRWQSRNLPWPLPRNQVLLSCCALWVITA